MSSTETISFAARRPIDLSRDFLQATDLASIVAQIGPALRELLSPDSALVTAHIEGNQLAAAFDCRGAVVPIQSAQTFYSQVQGTPSAGGRLILPDVVLETNEDTVRGSLLSISFPLSSLWGAVAVLWLQPLEPERLKVCQDILGYISELTGAAMSNLVSKMMLEEKVEATVEASKAVTDELAREIHRTKEEVR